MIPMIAGGAITALALAGVALTSTDTTTPPADQQAKNNTTKAPTTVVVSNPSNGTIPINGEPRTRIQVFTKSIQADSTTTDTEESIEGNTFVIAIQGDDNIFQSLQINAGSLGRLSTCLKSADSLVACGTGTAVNVCSYKNGKIESLPLANGKSMPVMVTNIDGKGQVIRVNINRTIDPNALVPVKAGGEGESEDMLMWFEPNSEFTMALPEEVDQELKTAMAKLDITFNDLDVVHNNLDVTMKNLDVTMKNLDVVMKDLDAHKADVTLGDEQLKALLESSRQLSKACKENSASANSLPPIPHVSFNDSTFTMNGKTFNYSAFKLGNVQDMNVRELLDSVTASLKSMNIQMDMDMKLDSNFMHVNNGMINIETHIINGDSLELSNNNKGVNKVVFKKRVTRSLDGKTEPYTFSSIVIMCNGKSQPTVPSPISSVREQQAQKIIQDVSVFPNPSTNGSGTISFSLSEPRNVSVSLADLSGNKVMDLVTRSERTAGPHSIPFNGGNLSSGMYLLTLSTANGERITQRFIVNN